MNLAIIIKSWRLHKELGIRAAAKTIDVSPATLSRIENGHKCDADVMLKLINFLFGETP